MAGTCTGPGPCDTSSFGAGKNWVNRVGGLPDYIRAVAHAFRRKGLSESEAIQRAVGVVKNWAEGKGGVTAATRARAAAAVAEWEAKKAASHSLTASPSKQMLDLGGHVAATVDLATEAGHVYHWRHGWIPITPAAQVVQDAMKGAPESDMLTHLHAVAARNVRAAKAMREKGMHPEAQHHHDVAMAAGQMHRWLREGRMQEPSDFRVEQRRRLAESRKASTAIPSSPTSSGGTIDRVAAAARMFGHGSKQHKAAAKKFGVSLTAAPAATVDLAWNEALHPRKGGKFAPKGSVTTSGSSTALPPGMAANVRDFQKRTGLPVTGVIDTATAAKIKAEVTPKGPKGRKGKSKATLAKRARAAQRKTLGQHVATVNSLSTGQRATVRQRMPVPPTGYVWTASNNLRAVPLTAAQQAAPLAGLR